MAICRLGRQTCQIVASDHVYGATFGLVEHVLAGVAYMPKAVNMPSNMHNLLLEDLHMAPEQFATLIGRLAILSS